MPVPVPLRLTLLALIGLLSIACDPKLEGLTIKTDQTAAARGTTVQLVASATYSDGSTQDLTSAVTWTSASAATASVSNLAGKKGLVQALAKGQAVISASYKEHSATTTLTVSDATLLRIDIAPPFAAIARGTSQLFTATGTFSDGTTQDLTASATWAAADSAVVTLSGMGGAQIQASGEARGSTTVTASALGKSGGATLSVSDAVLNALGVTPASATLAKGTGLRFTATGVFSDGTTQDLTSAVTWTSSDKVVASVTGAGYGVASALTKGVSTLTASLAGKSAAAMLTVSDASLASIAITPPVAILAKGTTARLAATGVFSDGTTQDLTSAVTWSSSQTAVATVVNMGAAIGTVSAVSQGAATISAALGGKSGSASLNVSDAALVSIAVSADSASVAKGVAAQLTATGAFSDGTTQDLTSLVAWSSSDTSIAAVSNAGGQRGRVTALAKGSATLSAALGDKGGALIFTVTDATLSSLTVTAASAVIAKGTSAQFTATGRYSDSSTADLTGQVAWLSSDPTVVSISNLAGQRGQAAGLTRGSVTITATAGGVSGAAVFHVSDAVLRTITISSLSGVQAAPIGGQVQLVASGAFSDGSTQDLSSLVTWTSGDSNRAVVSNVAGSRGQITLLAAGPVLLGATLSGVSGAFPLTVRALGFGAMASLSGGGADGRDSAIADLNGDGKMDLVFTQASTNNITVRLGNGDGAFQGPATYATDVSPVAVGVADLNGDKLPDLVTRNMGMPNNSVSVLLGKGDGTFNPHVDYALCAFSTGVLYVQVLAADFTGDGTIDIVTPCSGNSTLMLLPGKGDGTLQAAQAIAGYTGIARTLQVMDLNRDQKADVLVADSTTDLSVLLGNSQGAFQIQRVPAGGVASASTAADMNGDGRIDLVAALPSGVGVLLANQDGSFRPPQMTGHGFSFSSSLEIADMNRDGLLDLVIAAATFVNPSFAVFQARGDGGFLPPIVFSDAQPSAQSHVSRLGDLNGDGLPDVVTISFSGVYRTLNTSQ